MACEFFHADFSAYWIFTTEQFTANGLSDHTDRLAGALLTLFEEATLCEYPICGLEILICASDNLRRPVFRPMNNGCICVHNRRNRFQATDFCFDRVRIGYPEWRGARRTTGTNPLPGTNYEQ